MKRRKALMILLLVAIPTGATLATLAAKRAPIERFEFSEVLNLKGNAQIGRHKFHTWADALVSDYHADIYHGSAKNTDAGASPRLPKFEAANEDAGSTPSDADHHDPEHHNLLAANNFVAPSGGHDDLPVFADSPFTRLAGRAAGSGGGGGGGGSGAHSGAAGSHVSLDSKSGDAAHADDSPSHDAPAHDKPADGKPADGKPDDGLPGFFADNPHDDGHKAVTPPTGDVTPPTHEEPPLFVDNHGDGEKPSKPVSVPEPSTLWLFATALLAIGLRRPAATAKH